MIECSKCKSKAVSVVSVVNSKKSESALEIINVLQTLSAILFIIMIFLVISLMKENTEIFIPIVTGTYQITNALKDTAKVAENIVAIKLSTSVFSSSLLSFFVCAIIKIYKRLFKTCKGEDYKIDWP